MFLTRLSKRIRRSVRERLLHANSAGPFLFPLAEQSVFAHPLTIVG